MTERYEQSATLSAGVGNGRAGKGLAISGDGNTILVGAPGVNGASGSVTAFTLVGDEWIEGDTFAGDQAFGGAVALSSDGRSAIVNSVAYAYFYDYDDEDGWVLQDDFQLYDGPLQNPLGPGTTYYGVGLGSVAISADGTVAVAGNAQYPTVAIPNTDDPGPDPENPNMIAVAGGQGRMHIFQRASVADAWGEITSYTMPGTVSVDYPTILLGSDACQCVDISDDGTTIICAGGKKVGDPYNGEGGIVFVDDPDDGWIYQASLVSVPVGSGGQYREMSVALSADGNTAITVDPQDRSGAGVGSAFTRTGSTWTQQGVQFWPDDNNSSPNGGLQWGISSDLTAAGDVAVIGGNGQASSSRGAWWVFALEGDDFVQQGAYYHATLLGPFAGKLGSAIGITADGSLVAVSAPDDDNADGTAFVYAPGVPAAPAEKWGVI